MHLLCNQNIVDLGVHPITYLQPMHYFFTLKLMVMQQQILDLKLSTMYIVSEIYIHLDYFTKTLLF